MAAVVIVGAGPVGAVAAMALAARGIAPRVVESRAPAVGKIDRRSIALSWGSRLALERLGIWSRIDRADPIHRVSVSERGAFGTIEFTAADLGTPALGYVVDYGDLAMACTQALEAAAIPVDYQTAVVELGGQPDAMHLVLASDGGIRRVLAAACVVLADGAEGIAAAAGVHTRERAYRQVALVGEVACEHFMRARAYERFTGSGPLALLPRSTHYACVWVVEPEQARRLRDAGDEDRSRALESAAGPGFGAMRWLTAPHELPLALRRLAMPSDPRVVAVGNAAQTLHPVAGQGFNLGVRDALELAQAWPSARGVSAMNAATGDARSPDARLLPALARFRQSRRPDRELTMAVTDTIARVTAIDHPLAAALRGLGLAAIDLLPPVRRRALETLVFGRS